MKGFSTTWQINNIMTREKDSILLAEAYKNILNENSVMEYLNQLDPETLNIIAHALVIGGSLGVGKLAEMVHQKKKEKESSTAATAKIGKPLPQKINPDGSPDLGDQTGTMHGLSSTLKGDAAQLKGKRMPY